MLYKIFVNFSTTVEGATTEKLKECIENFDKNDDNFFAIPSSMTEVYNTVGNFKNKKVVGNDGGSAEVLNTSLPVIVFTLFNWLSEAMFVTRLVPEECKGRRLFLITSCVTYWILITIGRFR